MRNIAQLVNMQKIDIPNNLFLDHYWVGIPAIILMLFLILLFQKIFRRFVATETMRQCHEIGATYLQVIGTFYAVLLSLIVVDAMQKFQQAEMTVETEGSALLKLHTSAEEFPKQRNDIESIVKRYTNEVINVELKSLEKGEISVAARGLAHALIQAVKKIQPETENQKEIFSKMLSDVSDFWAARRDRTKPSNYGEPGVEWFMLILGGAITIAFTFFFSVDSNRFHVVLSGMVVLMILVNLYLILLFGSPFSGDLKVGDAPFRLVMDYINDYTERQDKETKKN